MIINAKVYVKLVPREFQVLQTLLILHFPSMFSVSRITRISGWTTFLLSPFIRVRSNGAVSGNMKGKQVNILYRQYAHTGFHFLR